MTNHQGNANQNHEMSSHTCQNWHYEKREMRSVGNDVEKREPKCTMGGNKLVQPLWKRVWRFLKKLKVELYNPDVPLLGIIQRK